MALCKWWEFHDWMYAGEVKVTLPKRGPYDPTSDHERTLTKEAYVCARCGARQTREQIGPGEFYSTPVSVPQEKEK